MILFGLAFTFASIHPRDAWQHSETFKVICWRKEATKQGKKVSKPQQSQIIGQARNVSSHTEWFCYNCLLCYPSTPAHTAWAAKARNRSPPNNPIARSLTKLARWRPPKTAAPVHSPWPSIPPKVTPTTSVCAARPIVAICIPGIWFSVMARESVSKQNCYLTTGCWVLESRQVKDRQAFIILKQTSAYLQIVVHLRCWWIAENDKKDSLCNLLVEL